MARPKKNNADYFSHDANMRNNPKIKALRNKFGVVGYAVWCMLLEYLTDSDGNIINDTEIEKELIAGDFGVSVTEISEMLDYCIRLELLTSENGTIYSKSLNNRLAPVYEKRARAKGFLSQKPPKNNNSCSGNSEKEGVSVTEITQSKVKKSKENKEISSIEDTKKAEQKTSYSDLLEIDLSDCNGQLVSDENWKETVCMNTRLSGHKTFSLEKLNHHLGLFFGKLESEGEKKKSVKDAKSHFFRWLQIELKKEIGKPQIGREQVKTKKFKKF